MVERFFAEITQKRIRRGVFKSVAELESAIMTYLDNHNAAPKPFVWTKTASEISVLSRRSFADRRLLPWTAPAPDAEFDRRGGAASRRGSAANVSVAA